MAEEAAALEEVDPDVWAGERKDAPFAGHFRCVDEPRDASVGLSLWQGGGYTQP